MSNSKTYIALARVSSREQEREGFSLDVQEDALKRYAQRTSGNIARLWRIAETASKADERQTFKELIAYARKNATRLDGILFYKVDRAARNLFDYVELERLESEYGVPFISVSQPTENNPAGRMQRRILASMASFFTEQLSQDVSEGLARRVQEGLFLGLAPYGYQNTRRDGRSVVEVHPVHGPKVARIFQLYATGQFTLDSLISHLWEEGIVYREATPRFPRSKLYAILTDRSYIGEIKYKGQWHPGSQQPLVDRPIWERVHSLLSRGGQRSHELTFAGGLILCGYCGHYITGEAVTKKSTGKVYVYYRCTHYNAPGHPRVRVTEAAMERQMLEQLGRLKVEDERLRGWFVEVLQARTREAAEEARARAAELQRQLRLVKGQQAELLNLRLLKEIDAEMFASKSAELRDREAELKGRIEAISQEEAENGGLPVQAFELAQVLRKEWLSADYVRKRQLLDAVMLNCRLNGASLVVALRKPFDMLAEGLIAGRGSRSLRLNSSGFSSIG